MSEFQDDITKKIIREVAKDKYIDLEKSTYETEHVIKKPTTYGRQDLFVSYIAKSNPTHETKICFEIKSGVEDLKSGYGMNFTEDYNFLVFEAGHGYCPIRTSHLKDIPKHIGILCVINGTIYCIRDATPKDLPVWMHGYFRMGFGRTAQELVEDVINCA